MSKGGFNHEAVARKVKALVSIYGEDSTGMMSQTWTGDRLVLSALASCMNELNALRDLSNIPAFIPQNGFNKNKHQNDELEFVTGMKNLPKGIYVKKFNNTLSISDLLVVVTPVGIGFIRSLRMFNCLNDYRQHYKFNPLLESLAVIIDEFADVINDLLAFSEDFFGNVFKFICLERLNLAASTLQSRINTDEHKRDEYAFYRPVRKVVDGRVSKFNEIFKECATPPYVTVLDLLFYSDAIIESAISTQQFLTQRHNATFSHISHAITVFLNTVRKRKRFRYLKGVLIKINYTKVKGWHAHAVLLFDIPPPRKELVISIKSEIDAVIDVWRFDVNDSMNKTEKSIRTYANIYKSVFICPRWDNELFDKLYFFSANIPGPNKQDVCSDEQNEIQSLVDVFDYLFLPQCLMKYKGEVDVSEARMVRGYRL
ncbi:hypothetical protein HQ395_19380 [Aeromonas hydrophila]|uniref:hypothetical protein n=1 Tax=Aeromonas hydrophila TaxID=644 RepID=UPI001C04EDE8|nr:hypothetical protein [Aeromonas hydrophila]QWL80746.1 hypothetical protein HQ395_19380 [Aeromonas hydrophila]